MEAGVTLATPTHRFSKSNQIRNAPKTQLVQTLLHFIRIGIARTFRLGRFSPKIPTQLFRRNGSETQRFVGILININGLSGLLLIFMLDMLNL